MKKCVVICSFFLAMCKFSIAQNDIGFAITTNLLNLPLKGPSLNIEKSIGKRGSINFYFSKGKFGEKIFLNYDSYHFQTLLLEYRLYESGTFSRNQKLEGFYIGFYAKHMNRELYRIALNDGGRYGLFATTNRDFKGQSLGSGFSLGGQKVFSKKIMIGVFSGIGAAGYIKEFDADNIGRKVNWHPDLRFGLQVGIKF